MIYIDIRKRNTMFLKVNITTRHQEGNCYIADIHVDGYTPISISEFRWDRNCVLYNDENFINNGYQLDTKAEVLRAYTSTPDLVGGFQVYVLYRKNNKKNRGLIPKILEFLNKNKARYDLNIRTDNSFLVNDMTSLTTIFIDILDHSIKVVVFNNVITRIEILTGYAYNNKAYKKTTKVINKINKIYQNFNKTGV